MRLPRKPPIVASGFQQFDLITQDAHQTLYAKMEYMRPVGIDWWDLRVAAKGFIYVLEVLNLGPVA